MRRGTQIGQAMYVQDSSINACELDFLASTEDCKGLQMSAENGQTQKMTMRVVVRSNRILNMIHDWRNPGIRSKNLQGQLNYVGGFKRCS